MKNPTLNRFRQGFSLLEVLVVISVVGLIAGIGVTLIGTGPLSGAKSSKLSHDVAVLNSAVSSYQASGGDLSGATTPEQVLAKLKTVATAESKRLLPGFSGSFVDTRAQFLMQTTAESESNVTRASWNAAIKRFEITNSGGIGIKAFTINTNAPEIAPVTEDRSLVMNYASTSKWIWDYEDAVTTPSTNPGPILVALYSGTDSSPIPLPPPSIPSPSPKALKAPLFSIPSGAYPYLDFDLFVSINDTNAIGLSQIVYSINYGEWNDYNGSAISMKPDSVITAQALPLDPSEWGASGTVQANYTAVPLPLERPVIEFSADSFSDDKSNPVDVIDVTLTNPNPTGSSKLIFQIIPLPGETGPETPFMNYSASFVVSKLDYPDGFGVRAMATAANAGYTDSPQASRFATDQEGLFGGHLDLDTSDFLSDIASGNTSAHTHDITGKYNITSIDFFAIPDSSQIDITDAIPTFDQKFKLTLVNGDLSPGLSVVIRYSQGGVMKSIDQSADKYDDTKLDELPTFTLSGIDGTARLESLKIEMARDVIYQAEIIPTNTGEVKDNTLGREGEWRNGSLTIQAVAVSSDGSDSFTTDSTLSAGGHGAATTGLIWEGALFWHWDGDSYSEEKNHYIPGDFSMIESEIKD